MEAFRLDRRPTRRVEPIKWAHTGPLTLRAIAFPPSSRWISCRRAWLKRACWSSGAEPPNVTRRWRYVIDEHQPLNVYISPQEPKLPSAASSPLLRRARVVRGVSERLSVFEQGGIEASVRKRRFKTRQFAAADADASQHLAEATPSDARQAQREAAELSCGVVDSLVRMADRTVANAADDATRLRRTEFRGWTPMQPQARWTAQTPWLKASTVLRIASWRV